MDPRRLLAASLLSIAALGASAIAGCGAAQPRTCASSSACAAGEGCVYGRCAPAEAPGPIAPNAERHLLEAESIAFVSSDGDDERLRPAYLALGADVGPGARILVKFPAPTYASDRVARAFLVLDRVQGAQAGPGDVTLRAERIVEPWSVRGDVGTSWASPPRSVEIAGAVAQAAPRGAAPIRVDVTAYAILLARKGETTWGLRVEGSGGGYGVPIATGFGASGAPPRLEVYLKP